MPIKETFTIRPATNSYEDICGVYNVVYPEGSFENIETAYKQRYVLDCICKKETYVAERNGVICGIYTITHAGNSAMAHIDYLEEYKGVLTPLFEAAKKNFTDNKYEHAVIFNDALSKTLKAI